MKRVVITVAAALAIAGPARADLPVTDAIGNALHLQEIAKWGQQLMAMEREFQQLQSTYYALAHVTDLGSAVGALSMLGIQNPLPVNPWAVQGLLNGTGGTQGMLSSLGGLYRGSLDSRRVYEVPGDDWLSKEINQNGGGIAGAKALAMQLYQSASERAQLLPQLQSLLGVTRDQTERETLIARIGTEQAYIQNQQVQAQTIATAMQAEFMGREQRREEHMQQSIDEVIADARSHGVVQ